MLIKPIDELIVVHLFLEFVIFLLYILCFLKFISVKLGKVSVFDFAVFCIRELFQLASL